MQHPTTDRLLAPELSPALAEHLAQCATCRAERALFEEFFSDAASEMRSASGGDGAPAAAGMTPLLSGERFPREALLQVAAALVELHLQGLSYGDLRPDDVLLDDGGRARLRAPSEAAPGPVTGAAALTRAPELRGGGRSHAGDRYALGALMRGLAAQFPDPPEGLEDLCRALTCEAPEERPADAELLSRLLLLPTSGLARYPVLGALGAGGMGEVIRVSDTSLNREIALKRLHPHLLQSRGQRERFVAEAQTIAQLQHPGIVPIFERGVTDDGAPYYTMPVVRGTTLGEVIADFRGAIVGRQWPEGDGRSLRQLIGSLRQACEAVGFAHSRGVVHRDLKPENIMLGAFGEVWVMDWGLARVVGDRAYGRSVRTVRTTSQRTTHQGTVTGTPAYMAPEQAEGEPAGTPSDVYALGTILYELLCGQLPYGVTEPGQMLLSLRERAPTPLSRRLESESPPVPGGLVLICERAMARLPDERYPDGVAFADALGDWLAGAERRRKARALATKATSLRGEARAREAEADALRETAAGLLAAAAATAAAATAEAATAEAWAALAASRAARGDARGKEVAATRQLQSALVFDAALPELHRALAGGYRRARDRALEAREPRLAEEAGVLLEAHLQALPAGDPARGEAGAEGSQELPRGGVALTGRVDTLAALEAWWAGEGRLLSLTGTAGAGKTRLATHFARRAGARVVFCELATARSADAIVREVAAALGLSLHQQDARLQVGRALRGRGGVLLVVDNLEQAGAAAGETLGRWLAIAPELRVLATSRARLGLDGEQVLSLSPLDPLSAAEMFEAVARRARPGFALSGRNLAAVLAIVASLDRLPLAIELAAARAGSLDLGAIQSWLSDRFALLRGRLRDPAARALEGALEASWSLLSEPERAALASCSVFRGGWNLAAAEAVLARPGDPPVLDLLEALVEDHLVVRGEHTGQLRFRLLESIRDFAGRKLGGGPQQAALAVQRHAAHFATYGPAWLEALQAPSAERYRDQMRERLNLKLGTAAEEPEVAASCALAMGPIYEQAGPFLEGAALLGEVIDRTGIAGELRAWLLLNRAMTLKAARELDAAAPLMREALDIAVAEGARGLEGTAHNNLGALALAREQWDEAGEHYGSALRIFREVGDRRSEGLALCNHGVLAGRRGDMQASLDWYAQALVVHREVGDRRFEGIVLGNIGFTHTRLGKLARADASLEAALVIHRAIGNHRFEAHILPMQAHLHVMRGRVAEARALYERAITLQQEMGDVAAAALAMGDLAALVAQHGDRVEARLRFEQALALQEEIDARWGQSVTRVNLGQLTLELGDVAQSRAHNEAAIALGEGVYPVVVAVARGGLGAALAAQGELDEARRLFGLAEAGLQGVHTLEQLKVMCLRGSAEHSAGELDRARAALGAIDALLATTDVPATSEVGQTIAGLRGLLG